jgi:ABC-type antimicrobial peptide transport system ATPase subunit
MRLPTFGYFLVIFLFVSIDHPTNDRSKIAMYQNENIKFFLIQNEIQSFNEWCTSLFMVYFLKDGK